MAILKNWASEERGFLVTDVSGLLKLLSQNLIDGAAAP